MVVILCPTKIMKKIKKTYFLMKKEKIDFAETKI